MFLVLYRATIFFTEPKYSDTLPSNIFLKADDLEKAKVRAGEIFKTQLDANGTPEAKFRAEVRESSEEEIAEYVKMRAAGHRTHAVPN